jgi:hypothetical protein
MQVLFDIFKIKMTPEISGIIGLQNQDKKRIDRLADGITAFEYNETPYSRAG